MDTDYVQMRIKKHKATKYFLETSIVVWLTIVEKLYSVVNNEMLSIFFFFLVLPALVAGTWAGVKGYLSNTAEDGLAPKG